MDRETEKDLNFTKQSQLHKILGILTPKNRERNRFVKVMGFSSIRTMKSTYL